MIDQLYNTGCALSGGSQFTKDVFAARFIYAAEKPLANVLFCRIECLCNKSFKINVAFCKNNKHIPVLSIYHPYTSHDQVLHPVTWQ